MKKLLATSSGGFISLTKKSLFILSAVLVGSLIYILLALPKSVAAAWYDDNWAYRIPVPVNNTGSAQTNVYVTVTLDTSDTNKFQSDCGDIRFTIQNGELLPYYIVSGCSSASTVIHVNFDSLPAGSQMIYAYYGNPSAPNGTTSADFSTAATGSSTVLNLKVNASNNDAFQYFDGQAQLGTGALLGTGNTASSPHDAYAVRFTSVTVPKNATISSAILKVRKNTTEWNSLQGTWYGQAADNPGVFTTGEDLTARGYTSASVAFDENTNKTNGTYYAIPSSGDWDTIVQELVNRSGWASGNAMIFVADGNGANSYTQNSWSSYDNNSTHGATLDITYVPPLTNGTLGTAEKAPSPVLYWGFDDASIGTAQDATTNNLDGTHNNTPTIKTEDFCVAGKCLWFDGTNNENVSLADNAKLDFAATDNFTIQAWVKRNGASSAINYIISKHDVTDDTEDGGYKLWMNADGDFCFGIDDDITWGPDINACSTNANFDDDKWHFVQGIRDQTGTDKIYLYVDGKDRSSGGTSDTTTETLANSNIFYVGVDRDGTSNEWLGYIDEVKVYPYARSAAQVQTDFNARSNNKGASAVLGLKDQKYLSDGLVGYWKMDESSWTNDCSTTSVTDSSGNGNNGQACPATTGPTGGATGKFGNTGDLDGNDDFVRVANSSSLSGTTKSIAFWVYLDSYPSAVPVIIEKGYYIQTLKADSYPSNGWYVTGVTGGFFGDNSTRVPTGQWTHYAFVYDGTNMNLYMNGELKTTAAGSGFIPNSGNMSIGTYTSNSSYAIDGKLDEFRIYNRTLSPKEVSDLYTFAPSPVGYWQMDEGSWNGTSGEVKDASGNGNNGTGSGGVTTTNTGKYGKAGNFDGSDDYVSASDQSALNPGSGNYTAEAWVNTSVLNAAQHWVYSDYGNDTNNLVALYLSSDDKFHSHFRDGSGNAANAASTSTLAVNTWYHVAAVRSGTTSYIYINGVQENSNTNASLGTITTSDANPPVIGKIGTPGNISMWNGKIDDVKIYNYARTQKQVIEDMGGGHPGVLASSSVIPSGAEGSRAGGPIGYWKFDEGHSTTANNSGSGGSTYNGTLSGSTVPSWSQAGKFGRALSFNGTSAYVNLSDNLDPGTASITSSVWVYIPSLPFSGTRMILTKGGSNTPTMPGLFIEGLASTSTIRVGNQIDTVSGSALSTFTVTTGWHHIVVVRDTVSNLFQAYLDGQNKVSQAITSVVSASNDRYLVIGGQDADAQGAGTHSIGNLYNSLIDEVKIYPYALTADEVKLDYNKGSSQVLGALSDTNSLNTSQPNSAASEYCIPGDTTSTSCAAPVCRWDFEEGSGTSAYDTSGNGYTGTWAGTGSHYQLGRIGKAANFNGTDDTVNISSAVSAIASGNFSVSFWFMLSSSFTSGAGGNNRALFSLGESGSSNDTVFYLKPSDGKLYFGVVTSTPSWANATTTQTSWVGGKWYHVTGTFSTSSGSKLYVNSIQDGSHANTTRGSSQSTKMYVGSDRGTRYWFTGKIDDTKAYNYARSAAQIAWDYNKGAPVAHWKMDECQGTTINDSSGNSLTGTLTIGALGGQTAVGSCTSPTDGTGAWYNGATGKYNASLDFDGTDDYAKTSSTLDLSQTNVVSVAFWLNWDTFAEDNKQAVEFSSNYNNVATGFKIAPNQTTSGSGFSIALNGDVGYSRADYTRPSAGVWHHYVAVFDKSASSNEVNLYMDGILQTPTSRLNNSNNTNNFANDTLYFMSRAGTSLFGAGQLDDVRIYNYALTGTQAKNLYNQGGAVRFGPSTGSP